VEIYGLIGKKLDHSFSPDYFSKKFRKLNLDADYRLFEIDSISELPEIIKENKNLRGLNVTIPYKKEVLQFLDKIDHNAKKLGSVNTIKIDWKNNIPHLTGYNTDIIGFEQTIIPLIKERDIETALILGTGGSAQAVAFVLDRLNVTCNFVSRAGNKPGTLAYENLDQDIFSRHKLIINTTPVGMFPELENAPNIPYNFIGEKHLLYDLIYNPAETNFLKKGRKNGARVKNGQLMLEIQADASWKIWQK
jgi:shikimate dehydrogenase